MTVKRKAVKKSSPLQYDLDDIINRGGKTTEDSKVQQQPEETETRFTLRIPHKLLSKMDTDRESRIGNVSRNQWILEAIAERLKLDA
jgi:hypothetical protein